MARPFFVTLAEELITGLISCPAKFYRADAPPQMLAFALTPSGRMMPVKVKVKKEIGVGEVYACHISFSPSRSFKDQQGDDCQSRNYWEVRLYPPKLETPVIDGELRFTEFSKNEACQISPHPIFRQDLAGEKTSGVIWIASPGVYYNVDIQEKSDDVIFSGVAQIDLGEHLVESDLGNAFRITGRGGLVIYDHRRGRSRCSGVAQVEHIRRRVGERQVEFVNIRRGQGNPTQLLTLDGLM